MQKNTVIDTDSMTFTFSDKDEEMFAWFKLNPTDPRVLKKIKNMMDAFMVIGKNARSASEYEEIVEKKFCEFLGYDCRQSLFGRIAATDIMKDGRCFASHVIDAMLAYVAPEIQRRRTERVAKYTAKYTK